MPPAVVCGLSWLVPGAGHFVQGRHQKGIVFLVALPLMFAAGLWLDGRLFPFVLSEPLVGLAAIANLGIGLPYLVASALGLGQGVVTAVIGWWDPSNAGRATFALPLGVAAGAVVAAVVTGDLR